MDLWNLIRISKQTNIKIKWFITISDTDLFLQTFKSSDTISCLVYTLEIVLLLQLLLHRSNGLNIKTMLLTQRVCAIQVQLHKVYDFLVILL